MKRLLIVCACGGVLSTAAMAADPYETWLTQQQQRGTEIELIRVANEKTLVETEATDEEVARILDEAEALDQAVSDSGDAEKTLSKQ